ncbi:LolA family protein [Ktedonospora formicarum]|uniref:Outer membrane lipoprotein carrier protein LolA n=1 Tax=Ktedonospora formicarum TaxID=2778364 RepID=A0A8J3I1U8_9CHLR|nr:hypothetical protein [Ktedonospora formicarum]GHO43954.1 hypothetical protein KSX_21170 [Ktedonospora formicarum]
MFSHRHSFYHFIAFCVLISIAGGILGSCALASSTEANVSARIQPTNLDTTPTATTTTNQGQQLLDRVSQRLNTAKTLQGNFTLTLKGQAIAGTIKLQQWSASPGKSRNEVTSSTLPQVTTGSLTVSDGQKLWQYDPTQKIAYVGPAQQTSSILTIPGRGQVQLLLNTLLSVFSTSDGTLVKNNASINGRETYQLHIVPQGSSNQSNTPTGGLDYQGELYLERDSEQPLRMDLNLSGIGPVSLNFDTLSLNISIGADKFRFSPPMGVKEELLPNTTNSNGDTLTLGQAQKQSGYHLLSISGDHSEYSLNGVTVLGTPQNTIYSLNYMKGNQTFIISQGKPLANLTGIPGQSVDLRGIKATFAQTNGIFSLSWTEKGIGIRIIGSLTQEQATGIAQLLI